MKWTIDSLIQKFIKTRAEFKTEIEQNIENHRNLSAQIASCEELLIKKTKELSEIENNFNEVVDQLKTKIDNK